VIVGRGGERQRALRVFESWRRSEGIKLPRERGWAAGRNKAFFTRRSQVIIDVTSKMAKGIKPYSERNDLGSVIVAFLA